MPFDTGMWLSPRMRVLPPDVRGLWVDLLCCMWESVERGVMVKPNLEIYTKDEIVRMIGLDATGGDGWLDLLVDNGICAIRESDGAYFSRQMVRGEEISAKRREAGKKGGDTTKAKMISPVLPEAPADPTPPKEEVKPPEQQAEIFPPEEVAPESPPPLTPKQKAKAEKAKKYNYAEYVTLTRDEYAKLCAEYGEDPTKVMIDILNNYKGSRGRRYKSDYLTIRGWVKDKYYEDLQKYGSKINGGATEPSKQTGASGYTSTL